MYIYIYTYAFASRRKTGRNETTTRARKNSSLRVVRFYMRISAKPFTDPPPIAPFVSVCLSVVGNFSQSSIETQWHTRTRTHVAVVVYQPKWNLVIFVFPPSPFAARNTDKWLICLETYAPVRVRATRRTLRSPPGFFFSLPILQTTTYAATACRYPRPNAPPPFKTRIERVPSDRIRVGKIQRFNTVWKTIEFSRAPTHPVVVVAYRKRSDIFRSFLLVRWRTETVSTRFRAADVRSLYFRHVRWFTDLLFSIPNGRF